MGKKTVLFLWIVFLFIIMVSCTQVKKETTSVKEVSSTLQQESRSSLSFKEFKNMDDISGLSYEVTY